MPANPTSPGTGPRLLKRWLRVLAVMIGFGQFWSGKYVIFADGISYLQIADNYGAGNWQLAVNAYWSPLLSWLIALASRISRQSPRPALCCCTRFSLLHT